MMLQDLPGYLEETLTFPTNQQTVRTQIGDVAIDAPGASSSLTVATVLARQEHDHYGSAVELFESIFANLPEQYVGRKYYSDRGGHVPGHVDGWTDGAEVSF